MEMSEYMENTKQFSLKYCLLSDIKSLIKERQDSINDKDFINKITEYLDNLINTVEEKHKIITSEFLNLDVVKKEVVDEEIRKEYSVLIYEENGHYYYVNEGFAISSNAHFVCRCKNEQDAIRYIQNCMIMSYKDYVGIKNSDKNNQISEGFELFFKKKFPSVENLEFKVWERLLSEFNCNTKHI